MARSDDSSTQPRAAGAPSLSSSLDQEPIDIVGPVVADASELTGWPVSEIVVVSCAEVTWPDGSLGCPQPGMLYPQALVDGYRVIVRAGGRDLDYRVRGPGWFRRCLPGSKDDVPPIR